MPNWDNTGGLIDSQDELPQDPRWGGSREALGAQRQEFGLWLHLPLTTAHVSPGTSQSVSLDFKFQVSEKEKLILPSWISYP